MGGRLPGSANKHHSTHAGELRVGDLPRGDVPHFLIFKLVAFFKIFRNNHLSNLSESTWLTPREAPRSVDHEVPGAQPPGTTRPGRAQLRRTLALP